VPLGLDRLAADAAVAPSYKAAVRDELQEILLLDPTARLEVLTDHPVAALLRSETVALGGPHEDAMDTANPTTVHAPAQDPPRSNA
jgi:hypothetical protein